MTRIKMVGLALVACCAMAFMASSAVAAGPVFFGKAEVGKTVANVAFTGTLGAAFLEGKGGTKITCTGGTANGEITGATTTANNLTDFTGCETSGVECHNAGAKEIITKVLQARSVTSPRRYRRSGSLTKLKKKAENSLNSRAPVAP